MTVNDDFDDITAAFLAWLQQNNVSISPKIRLADLRGHDAGRGVVAIDDIDADEDLFSIPRSAILLPETSTIPSSYLQGLDEPWLALILAMIWEHQQGARGKWLPYLNVLPRTFNTLMFWSEEELSSLQGSAVLNKIGRVQAEEVFRTRVIPVITTHVHDFKAVHMDSDQLLQLCHLMGSTIMAYAFDLEASSVDDGDSSSGDSWAEDDEKALPVGMVPLADMLNANADKNNAKLYYEADRVVMRSIKTIKQGEEIYNDYGALPRADLLRRYGYITDEYTKYDVVEIDQDMVCKLAEETLNLTAAEIGSRLDYLDQRDIATDAFEIVHEAQEQAQIAPELISTAFVLTQSAQQFADLATKRAKLPKPDSPLDARTKVFLLQLLSARLKQYNGIAVPSNEQQPSKRHLMARKVVAGERDILEAAINHVQQYHCPPQAQQSSSDNERPHKRMRT